MKCNNLSISYTGLIIHDRLKHFQEPHITMVEIFQTNRKKYKELMDNRNYEYDAFISYCVQDRQWVMSNLLRLETEFNKRLCFHERDWLAGRYIVDNIVQSVENSRKIVMVMSNAFVNSQWCLFELEMVQTKLFEVDRDNMIMILIEEIEDCNIPPRLKLQMARQTYIEWPGESKQGEELFWKLLNQSLSKASITDDEQLSMNFIN